MEIKRVTADAAALLDPANAIWQQAAGQDFPMVPTPLKGNPAIEAISPFIAQSTDHGVIHGLSVARYSVTTPTIHAVAKRSSHRLITFASTPTQGRASYARTPPELARPAAGP